MNTYKRNSMGMSTDLVCNTQKRTSYDVYLNNKAANTTSSVFDSPTESNTFLNTGKVLIGSKYIVSREPEVDADASFLQDALLHNPQNIDYAASDFTLNMIYIGVFVYVAVTLVIWGSI